MYNTSWSNLALFSERHGIKPRQALQLDTIDDDTRIRLWNLFHDVYAYDLTIPLAILTLGINWGSPTKSFYRELWGSHLALNVARFDSQTLYIIHNEIQKYFYECEWNEVFDLLEYTVKNYPDAEAISVFIEECNKLFEKDNSGYRFVDMLITPITTEEEIKEIEKALSYPLKPVHEHLQTALIHFSNRDTPDYRNSIKESISAVESLCNLINEGRSETLGKTLTNIEKRGRISIHGALKSSFSSLYGWTSDAEGIRHALMEDASLSSEDARFMLVSCSAFINYLVVKAQKAGLSII